tara:strand:+ start:1330 stop:1638 length:309 start_codon:yes stop_codon:yes gene_type:complete
MQIFNPLYNKEQILRFTNYFLHEQITPHIENNSHSLYYVFINNKNNVPYIKFHNNINKFLGVQPTPNNPAASLPSAPISSTPAEPKESSPIKKPIITFNDLS